MNLINYYLIIINIYQFIIMGLDKLLAIKKKNRISEKTLLLNEFIGGSIGSIFGMYFFRHKTKKVKFQLLYPTFFIIHLFIYLYIKKTLF